MLNEYVFHSHTFRCGHAEKDIEDYVTEVIKQGYKKYGVSDHVFLPGVISPYVRGDYSHLGEYIHEFKRCKSLYGNQIEMYLGFECEWSPYYKKYYESLLRDRGFDFLICGQHMGFDENFEMYGYLTEDQEHQEAGLLRYKNDVIEGIKSGLFLYLAHPDFFFLFCKKITPIYEQITKEIIEAAIEYDVPLEINIHGILRKLQRKEKCYLDYPCEYFWKEAAKTNVKIVYGGDFHNPVEMDMQNIVQEVENLIKRTEIKLSDMNQIYNHYQQRLSKLGLR